jgi:hypothetical protein
MRGRGNMQRGYMARREEEKGNEEEAGWEQVDQYGFVVRKFGDRLGPEFFLLDSAATSHMVDEMVVLQDEKQVDIEVKGVAAARATGTGIFNTLGGRDEIRGGAKGTRFGGQSHI